MMVKDKHYRAFVDKYTTPAELGIDGLDCYRLRGGVIHRGNAIGHPKFTGTHVIFTTSEKVGIHALTLQVANQEAAMFDLRLFCSAMINAALRWYQEHQNHPKVIENMPKLLSYRPLGVPPFVDGIPVVASEA